MNITAIVTVIVGTGDNRAGATIPLTVDIDAAADYGEINARITDQAEQAIPTIRSPDFEDSIQEGGEFNKIYIQAIYWDQE